MLWSRAGALSGGLSGALLEAFCGSALEAALEGLLWSASGTAYWELSREPSVGYFCGVLLWSLSGALSYFGLKDIYYMLVWVFCFKGL